MLLSNLEYVSLRLLRRFVFREAFLLRWGRLLPYYRTNLNQVDPAPLVSAYARHVTLNATVRDLLEIGVGATNSTGYELAARLPGARVVLLEPFVPLDATADARLLRQVATAHRCDAAALAARVRRVATLADLGAESIDLILSSSVLEHVSDPAALFAGLRRVLRADGAMLHLVDYRDHFFKYPLHFLQFSRATWERWLNPGDLPRWRLYDHLDALETAGFIAELPEVRRDPAAFARIAPLISPEFRRDHPQLGTTYAAIVARPR
jgi:SAM-dependent methyltransferase